jgi:hypothetical protein
MALLGIELNDAALTGCSVDGIIFSEPGCAFLQDAGAVFGTAATAAARIQPKAYFDRYWRNLSEQALPGAPANMETHADIAFAQLHNLWEEYGDDFSEVALAVPGWWTNDQLALLLGISQEAGIPVAALVPAALAATRCQYPEHDLLYLDVGLHAVCVTRLDQDGGVTGGDTDVIENVGIAALDRTCAEYFARRFLECSRFDPMYEAHSEQAVYDQMADWVALLERNSEATVTLEHQGSQFTAQLQLAELVEWLQRRYQPLVQALRAKVSSMQPTAIQVPASLAGYPGISNALADLPGCDVYVLEPGAAARGMLQRQEHLARGTGALGLTSALPWDQPPAEVDVSRAMATAAGSNASHVVLGGLAYRLVDKPLRIGSEGGTGDYNLIVDPRHTGVSRSHCSIEFGAGRASLSDHSRFGTRLNGHRVAGSVVLRPGDVISLGDPVCELTVIGETSPSA